MHTGDKGLDFSDFWHSHSASPSTSSKKSDPTPSSTVSTFKKWRRGGTSRNSRDRTSCPNQTENESTAVEDRSLLRFLALLSGHPDCFAPAGPGTIWKKRSGGPENAEREVYEALGADPAMRDIIPHYFREVEYQGEKFIELQDLLHGFTDPLVMDVKMGTRTFLESEVQKTTGRPDLYLKAPSDREQPGNIKSSRIQPSRTLTLIKQMNSKVMRENPLTPKIIARRKGISPRTVELIIHENLHLPKRHKARGHHLKEKHIEERFTNMRKLNERHLIGKSLQRFYRQMADETGIRSIPVKSSDASPIDFCFFCLLKRGLSSRRPKTTEEHRKKAVTKLRYMQFRELQSSTCSQGFRIEALKFRGSPPVKDLKKVKSREEVMTTMALFLGGREDTRQRLIARLKEIRDKFEQSVYFQRHEVVGSSIFMIYDDTKVGAWIIDFAKTLPVPNGNIIKNRKI
ncbi:hypothetical protein C0J52_05368 [Blattella germanica]|nr:hypothetical protein C0J52_05368 [Blattella germanica]